MQDDDRTRADTCRCGHEKVAHEHFRAGTDCARCECPRYRAARRPWWRLRPTRAS